MGTWQARVAASIFVGVSLPVVATLWFSSQSALVAVLVLYGWVALVGDRTKLGGILLGAAIVLKVFPGILLLPLLVQRRWRAQAATDPLPWLLLALLVLPIAWGSYDVVLLPVALAVFAGTTRKVKPHALFMLACWVLPLFFFPYGKNGIFIFFSRLTISAMWLNGMLRVSEAATYLHWNALAWESPPKRADSHHQD